jgi:hypothetical protein
MKQSALAQGNRREKSLFRTIFEFLRDFRHSIFDTYHPEAHYMRGPGPACAAKRMLRP